MESQIFSDPQVLNQTVPGVCFYIVPSFVAVWSLLLFPLYFLVLNTGFQRWRQNKLSSVSHSDFLTFHMFLFECLLLCGYVTLSHGILQSDDLLMQWGTNITIFTSPGLLSLHVLTCVERYLAVVYPVVYLSLRKQKWIQARRCIMIVILLVCAVWLCVLLVTGEFHIPIWCLMGAVSVVVSFCSVHVLCVLRNPSPGEGHRVSESKRKAFFTILAILSTLLLWFTGGIVVYGVLKIPNLPADVICRLVFPGCWLVLPSSLVLPLLFLHRAGKLPQCRGKKGKNPGLELN